MGEPTALRVQMLGTFTLSAGDARITDSDNRSKKVWLFLAYLIYNRGKAVEAQSFIDLLWSNKDEGGSNPANALKTILHRVRSTLDQLWPGAGHALVLRQGTSYRWNEEYPVALDIEEFDRLYARRDVGDETQRLRCCLDAAALYGGEFLARFSSCMWTVPIAAYYQQCYLQLAQQALPVLRQQERYGEMEALCRAAVAQCPYAEELYYHLIDSLAQQGKQREVTVVYEDMAHLLMDDFGVVPSEKIRSLYRQAVSAVNERSLSPDMILEQLREPEGNKGTMICPYDTFCSIYRSFARSLARSGDVVHLAIFSVQHKSRAEELPRRSLERVMDNLEELIRDTLRRGDVAARCSQSQIAVLLPQANFENSEKVCQRIQRTFQRQYPHSPALLQFTVYPLEPN